MEAPVQKTKEKVAEDSGARLTLHEQSVLLSPHAPHTPGLHSSVPSVESIPLRDRGVTAFPSPLSAISQEGKVIVTAELI